MGLAEGMGGGGGKGRGGTGGGWAVGSWHWVLKGLIRMVLTAEVHM